MVKEKKRLGTLIIGPYPPPIGGVSIHVKRFVDYLINIGVNDFKVYDDSKVKANVLDIEKYVIDENKVIFLLKLLLKCKIKRIHYHSHNWYIRLFLILIGKIHKTEIYFTFHSFRDNIDEFSLIKKMIAQFTIRNGDYFIAVSEGEKNKLIKNGCESKKIFVIPAFIAPSIEANQEDNIPKYIKEFIEKHDMIITANASGIRFFNGADLYGIDMCIELLGALSKMIDKQIGLIFLMPQIENIYYYKKINDRIEELGIRDHFLFVNENIQMFKIIQKSSIILRPTNSDGDAISIRESLYYKIPVIASDVVSRPEGTILFKTRNQADLQNKVIEVIENYDYYKKQLDKITTKDYAEDIINIYNHQK